MSIGSPGDSPLTDLLHWDRPSEFPQDITLMLLRLKNEFEEELLRLPPDSAWWCLPEKHEEGRRYLLSALERRGIDTAYYRDLALPKIDAKRKWWRLWT
jgi:hypothetical protein